MPAGQPAARTDRYQPAGLQFPPPLFAIICPCRKRALEQKSHAESEGFALKSVLSILPIQVLNWNNLMGHICSASLSVAFFCGVPFVHFGFSKLLTELDTNIFTLIGCFCGSQINQPAGI